jgi:hypothetical protein
MDIDKTIRIAYVEGALDRVDFDEDVNNYFINLAHCEGERDRNMFPNSYGNINKILEEAKKWGAYDRREETSWLLR